MSDLSTWWDGLSVSLKIYWALAIPFTVLFIVQLVLSFVGTGDVPDDSPDVDAEIHGDGGIPFQFLTLKNLIAFFTIFGWIGIACVDSGFSEVSSLVMATIAGLLMALIMTILLYLMGKANVSGTMILSKAIGGSGEVYLPIKGKREGIGQVQIKVQGVLRTLEAMTDEENDIPTGKIITVKEIVSGNILLVSTK